MAITGTVTSAQGVLTLGSSLNDAITFTPASGSYTVEYPLGTVAISASTSAQTLALTNGGQLRILCVSGSVSYSLAEVRDSYALTPAELQATAALVSGAGISAPSALFANLPAAEDNAGNVIRVTDIGKGGTLWMPSGDIWAPVNGRAQLLRTPVPFILSSSGSIGNNGALTLSVALDRVYARSFMYFPANAIFAGSAAGWYWTVMSSTTVGTIYNNTYTSGYPSIPTIAGFTTTGPGAFTQTAGVDLTCLSVTLPGGCLYRYGGLQSRLSMTSGGAGGVKTGKVFAGVSQFHVTTIAAANNFANALGGFAMDGSTNTLKTTHAEQTAGVSNGVTYSQIIFTNDMTVDKTVAVTIKHAAAATDWVVLQEAEIEVLGG